MKIWNAEKNVETLETPPARVGSFVVPRETLEQVQTV